MAVPTLTTDRLTLRGWRPDDLEPYAEITADPEVMRFMGGVLDRAEAWRQMALFAGHWELRGYGLWAVEHQGRLVGRIGLWNPDGWPGLEVGWLLGRDAWGRGYATEAARASVEFAWHEVGADRVISLIAPQNTASQRVAGRLGMSAVGDYLLHGNPVLIHALDRTRAAE